ncbi:hypothetical protein L3I75_001198 [Vibrio vulnificus]|uniref:hypothetical protein n=1 Tax=Vibrio vulnificus TaxID=672 RepID=UPI001028DF01|nr:hypothetical protein [Vibrio vulnificus]EGR0130071.1 hypothetical protein [Vibrio vulnificus]EIU7612323.1 hypothetical protein [Vibrio vulnificus]EIU7862115.1 hypothetical protein [Vibrio vulnificus]EJE8579383.1 hypothetical protein [Vibrio vulnificus]MCA3898966.1 hypothetical protein [Vibrio vulnificus]
MHNFEFHESTVTNFLFADGSFVIELEDVSFDETKVKVIVEVESVSRILIDSELADIVTMPAEDGEVLSFKLGKSRLDVLIEWNDFSIGKSVTHSYDITGEKLNVTVA